MRSSGPITELLRIRTENAACVAANLHSLGGIQGSALECPCPQILLKGAVQARHDSLGRSARPLARVPFILPLCSTQ